MLVKTITNLGYDTVQIENRKVFGKRRESYFENQCEKTDIVIEFSPEKGCIIKDDFLVLKVDNCVKDCSNCIHY